MMTDRCIHLTVIDQAARTPDATAIVFGSERLSYRELDEASNRIAHRLRALGVGPDVLVALCLERSLELVPVLLGVLKAGGAYVPLDPGHPRARQHGLLEDCRPRVLVTEARWRDQFVGVSPVVLEADRLVAFAAESSTPLPPLARPDNLAYVIYTSGSTGVPKAVMCTHRGLANTLEWHHRTYHLAATDRMPLKTPYTFDPSLLEIFWPLMAGGHIVVARPDGHKDPMYLAELIRTHGITLAQFVPSALRAFLEVEGIEALRSLRLIVVGGEALAPDLQNRLFERLPVELANHYGPTESSIDATVWRCQRDHRTTVPIGQPITNTRVFVVDNDLTLVSTGSSGELCLGGAGLARGYLNRPAHTAERFVPDPFGEPGGRIYRTGDLVRQDPEGNIEFIGRLDHQIKIRGFRVELGEIEATLEQHSSVAEAVVLAHEVSRGQLRLFAHVLPRGPHDRSTETLQGHLRARLPDHMVPQTFVFVDAMPRLATEKVDRAALLAILIAQHSTGGERGSQRLRPRAEVVPHIPYVPPRDAVEEAIAAVWQEVLALDPIGATDRFLDLGGDSLHATRATLRLRERLGVDVQIRLVLQNAPLAELAAEIAATRALRDAGSSVIAKPRGAAMARRSAVRTGTFPATRTQRQFWMEAQIGFDNAMPDLLELEGPIDVRALQLSLDMLVRRHAALRTTFDVVGEDVVQVIGLPGPAWLEIRDLSSDPPSQRAERAKQMIVECSRAPFDLLRGPLFRTHLLKLAPDHHFLLWNFHHITGDHASIFVLYEELSALYGGYCNRQPVQLPPVQVDAVDVARWDREAAREKSIDDQVAYWRGTLDAAALPLDLPVARPRPAQKSVRGANCMVRLSPAGTAGLRALARAEGATFNMAVMSGIFAVLHRYTGREDLVIGVPVTTRDRVDFERMVGCFVNQVPVSIEMSGEPSFRQLLKRVRASALDAYSHKDVPFERMVREISPVRGVSHNPLYQVLFELARDGEVTLQGLRVRRPWPPHSGRQHLDLAFILGDEDDRVAGEIMYNADLFDATTAAAIAEHFAILVDSAVKSPDAPLGELSMSRDQ